MKLRQLLDTESKCGIDSALEMERRKYPLIEWKRKRQREARLEAALIALIRSDPTPQDQLELEGFLGSAEEQESQARSDAAKAS